ncbi:MAG: hypothetical protein LQ347_006493 [Umbilicaria vellea]|nr:MAG: hypothetical protein LQ347_006493 [Umbilicaria vellea]
MSTPFYARYIPPPISTSKYSRAALDKSEASKKRKRDSGPPPKPIKALLEVENASSATKELVVQEAGDDVTQLKERNKEKDRTAAHDKAAERTGEAKSQVNGEPAAAQLDEEKTLGLTSKKNQRKKRKSDGQEVDQSGVSTQNVELHKEQVVDEDTKHTKIRSKFERSLKRAARLSEKEKNSKDVENPEKDESKAPVETHGLVPLPQPEEIPDTVERPAYSALPPWLANPIVVASSDTIPFTSLSISPNVLASLEKKGYSKAFAVQSAVLPLLLPGPTQDPGDVCISASTGSGKTLSYVLPMVESLRGKPVTRLRGLVVVPTRELVSQVRETCELCAPGTGLKIGTAVGSKSIKEEQNALIRRGLRYDPEGYRAVQNHQITEEEWLMDWNIDNLYGKDDELWCLPDFVEDFSSNVDILICTPGRLVDHLQSTKGFTLKHVQWLAIDEADRLLDQSFQQWIDVVMPALHAQEPLDPMEELILQELHIKKSRQIRKIVLSATMTRDIGKLTGLKLTRPKMVVLDSSHPAEDISNRETRDLQKPDEGALPDPHASFDLPATLKEVAIAVGSGEDKPLYLLHFLTDHKVNNAVGLPSKSSSRPAMESPRSSRLDSSTDDSSSEDDSSSDSDGCSTSSSDPNSSSSDSESNAAQIQSPSRASSASSTYGTLIFTNNNENALRLARLLVLLEPLWESQIGTLTGSSATSSGRKTLAAFRKRKLAIIVASDRASRGLDIQDLAHVINYDLPISLTSYVHRVGRTARAGKEGTATTFVAHREARWFWNEIGKSEQVKRGPGKKVSRLELNLKAGDKERKRYVEALGQLGREARGETA